MRAPTAAWPTVRALDARSALAPTDPIAPVVDRGPTTPILAPIGPQPRAGHRDHLTACL
jgi:hypothetical protein